MREGHMRPFVVRANKTFGLCVSCGARTDVADIAMSHGGEGMPTIMPLCKECYAKVLNEMMEEFGRVFPFKRSENDRDNAIKLLRGETKQIPVLLDQNEIELLTLRNNSLNELKKEVKRLESERDNWRKQALSEDERANFNSNNASAFGSYKEMVAYWSSHYEEIKKPLMAWAFEKGGVK